MRKKLLLILGCLFVLSPSLARGAESATILAEMPLRQKVSQLFMLRLPVPEEGENMLETVESFVEKYPAGGYVLFREHCASREEIAEITDCIHNSRQDFPPLIGIDEEGGTVSRLRDLPDYATTAAADMASAEEAHEAGSYIGQNLAELGLDLDFAPVADVWSNPENTVVARRAFGRDPETVAELASAFQRGLQEQGLLTCAKHFPGHGNTTEDSHYETAVNFADAEHLQAVEYPPFQRLIEEGCDSVMLGHIQVPEVDESGYPATLSPYFATEILRGEFCFEGLIITDAMEMQAITEKYQAGEDAVLALEAGVDIILLPADYEAAVEAVLAAVEEGRLSEERIDDSVRRILQARMAQ